MARGTHCTIQLKHGDFCDAPAAEDMPFPICTPHALQLYRHLRGVIDGAIATFDGKVAVGNSMVSDVRREQAKRDAQRVVYYIRVGDMIKIGYTENLRARMAAYPPGSKLLATERGGLVAESRRHMQFAEFRTAGNEWFRIEQPLIDHINDLRRTARQPPLSLTKMRSRM